MICDKSSSNHSRDSSDGVESLTLLKLFWPGGSPFGVWLPHLIYFALTTNYFNVFMSTTVLLGLTSLEKMGASGFLGGQ